MCHSSTSQSLACSGFIPLRTRSSSVQDLLSILKCRLKTKGGSCPPSIFPPIPVNLFISHTADLSLIYIGLWVLKNKGNPWVAGVREGRNENLACQWRYFSVTHTLSDGLWSLFFTSLALLPPLTSTCPSLTDISVASQEPGQAFSAEGHVHTLAQHPQQFWRNLLKYSQENWLQNTWFK